MSTLKLHLLIAKRFNRIVLKLIQLKESTNNIKYKIFNIKIDSIRTILFVFYRLLIN